MKHILSHCSFGVLALFFLFTGVSQVVAQTNSGNSPQPISPKRIFDFNGDGVPDTITVDLAYSSTQSVSGKVEVSSGDAFSRTFISDFASDMFGAAVVPLGNIDGVPGDELAIAAPLASTSDGKLGVVYIYSHGSVAPLVQLDNPSLADPGPMDLFCRAAFLGYDMLQAVQDYIGCGGLF